MVYVFKVRDLSNLQYYGYSFNFPHANYNLPMQDSAHDWMAYKLFYIMHQCMLASCSCNFPSAFVLKGPVG